MRMAEWPLISLCDKSVPMASQRDRTLFDKVASEQAMAASPVPQMRLYTNWLREHRGLEFPDYNALWRWSVTDIEGFWQSIWDFHTVNSSTSYKRVLSSDQMPGAVWFEGARLNFCAHVLRHVEAGEAAGEGLGLRQKKRGGRIVFKVKKL